MGGFKCVQLWLGMAPIKATKWAEDACRHELPATLPPQPAGAPVGGNSSVAATFSSSMAGCSLARGGSAACNWEGQVGRQAGGVGLSGGTDR